MAVQPEQGKMCDHRWIGGFGGVLVCARCGTRNHNASEKQRVGAGDGPCNHQWMNSLMGTICMICGAHAPAFAGMIGQAIPPAACHHEWTPASTGGVICTKCGMPGSGTALMAEAQFGKLIDHVHDFVAIGPASATHVDALCSCGHARTSRCLHEFLPSLTGDHISCIKCSLKITNLELLRCQHRFTTALHPNVKFCEKCHAPVTVESLPSYAQIAMSKAPDWSRVGSAPASRDSIAKGNAAVKTLKEQIREAWVGKGGGCVGNVGPAASPEPRSEPTIPTPLPDVSPGPAKSYEQYCRDQVAVRESGPGIEKLPPKPVLDMSDWASEWDLLPDERS